MNEPWLSNPLIRGLYRVVLATRHLRPLRRCRAFETNGDDLIQLIHVINLDRQEGRWHRIKRELSRVGSPEQPLTAITRRFSAFDARYRIDQPDDELVHDYTLAEQLYVDPRPTTPDASDASTVTIEMSQQEAAVARSHIGIWKLIAESGPRYTMVLEDDAYFAWKFATTLDRAWAELRSDGETPAFDLLYLSYREVQEGAEMIPTSAELVKPIRGLWQLSGYVLSRTGARKLLNRLPVRGPIDLWINHQFPSLRVLALRKPVVHQRLDYPSSNSHSILPTLSRIGILDKDKPPSISTNRLAGPVFAVGEQGTGLTSLATALSTIGYTCLSDVEVLPDDEEGALFAGRRDRVFNAYVNIGSLGALRLSQLAGLYPQARFIVTSRSDSQRPADQIVSDARTASERTVNNPDQPPLKHLSATSANILVLPIGHADKWQLLAPFLRCDYPSHTYPEVNDKGHRPIAGQNRSPVGLKLPETHQLKHDTLPWIVEKPGWNGLRLEHREDLPSRNSILLSDFSREEALEQGSWILRDDTFPGNLALFRPANFRVVNGAGRLTLREEDVVVRSYTSACLSSSQSYLYGRFTAELRPARLSGLITGLFLHRNSPKQEIDIEFLGNDTTKLMVNVYYNPGYEGAALEYGYRGTPTMIQLDFDAADDFHLYEVEWSPTALTWSVDGRIVHRRLQWNPTPIPHLPMRFYMNLWHSRSAALAGRLHRANLPKHAELRRIEIHV